VSKRSTFELDESQPLAKAKAFTAADSNRQFGGTLVSEFEPAEH